MVLASVGLAGVVACGGDDGGGRADAGTLTTGIDFGDTGAGDSGQDAGDETGAKLDLPANDSVGGGCDPSGSGDAEFSYIWISNSEEGTVSKIDTNTGDELGRYYACPAESDCDPSRTSVNLAGDVAVSVRAPGGITKIAALEDNCADQDGDGVIQTSTGAGDILAWGSDECVLWHTDIPSIDQYSGPRPTAWDQGTTVDADSGCVAGPARVWVGYRALDSHGVFLRLDGATGAILDTVDGPTYESRPYGGAVDGDGNFWVTGWQADPAIMIDGETLQVVDYGNPGIEFYGMALDEFGNLIVADRSDTGAMGHLDAASGQWTVVNDVGGKTRGIMADRDGRAWLAGNNPCRLVQVDLATDTVVDAAIALPGCDDPVGVSIDPDGFVWVVDRGANQAYKVDPDTKQVALTVTGLVGPYTYSDMTGGGLALVTNPPQG